MWEGRTGRKDRKEGRGGFLYSTPGFYLLSVARLRVIEYSPALSNSSELGSLSFISIIPERSAVHSSFLPTPIGRKGIVVFDSAI